MATEEERELSGKLFRPGHPDLRKLKAKAHRLSKQYNSLGEEATTQRNAILRELIGSLGEEATFIAPIFFHYGVHTHIGNKFFGNTGLVIQDDGEVTIGNNCRFGPNVTIVTPLHPMVASERRQIRDEEGHPAEVCHTKPVHIGDDCWLCTNVVICPGVTIGDRCVIGAGAVVTQDIPADSFAAGVPCRVIRKITEADSLANTPDLLDVYSLYETEENL